MNITQLITRFKQEHYIRGNSPKTTESYVSNCLTFFKFLESNPLDRTERDVKSFIYHLRKSGKSAATCNQYIYSLKSFYSLFRGDNKTNPTLNIQRVKVPNKKPSVLSIEEVADLLDNCHNTKHKAFLTVTYSAGLRLSEVQHLKLTDIDSKRVVIKVTGKGNKQRLLPLHESALNFLRHYYRIFKPKTWLFEGRVAGETLNASTYQRVVKNISEKAGIKKRVSMHTLRHCYATHLLDHNVSIKIIQELLGHKSLQTTQIYTHVTSEMKSKVFSPITLLDLQKPNDKKKGEDNE